ncbi:MAG: hypothetical protein AAGA46_03410 [Cyanobacteria bacterium P01_F01_bin.13]
MVRRKAKETQNSLVRSEAPVSAVTPAQVPAEEVALNDVQVPTTPAGSITGLVQEAVDEGANAADLTTQAFAQSYTARLTQNMPTAFGQMGKVTRTLLGGITETFAQVADLRLPSANPGIESADFAAIEGTKDEGNGQG